MVKRALCVGINNYPYADSDLKGCVNDARAWADLLISQFDFPAENVVLMEDSDARKSNLMAALRNLMRDAQEGDVLVFTNSSHGSYVVGKGSDEEYDEILCPYDIKQSTVTDDELRTLFDAVPNGVHLTAILDNCFSGTGTRLPPTPDDRRTRYLDPGLRGDPVLDDLERAARRKKKKQRPESRMKDVLLSGCSDKQVSYDARIDDEYHGAMTYHAIKAIRDANFSLTYSQLHNRLLDLLADTPYDQTPQLEGKAANKERPIFS